MAAAPSPTSGYPKTPDVVYASISSLIPVRLDSSNFTIWKFLMTTMFKAHNLLGYVDGSIMPPEKFLPNDAGEPTVAISPSYETWMAHDAGVMVLIHATLSNSALSHIIGCDTARELWLKLEENCSSLLNFHITKYRSDLERSTKGSDSVHAYVQRIEEIRDRLKGFDVVVDDAEMIVHAMRGLPTEYNPFRASLAVRTEPLSLDGFYVLLLEEEAALRARNQYQFPPFADAQWSSNQCQICNEAGHTALVCPHRMDFTYQGVQNQ
ncbi:putative transcription factor interactor and regulator CCHC(Zn) family [Rosa chinensis]|uniref:Putative transcription factor interactor and regulator CCHC(Zn) family n=1 Tax=Rosa chinensis TaxID=74649 RepID=A0A2P6P937_ROSCH|nr:putative transcription factor interactor and regulator CCHC(Zn) family [Rosa chinensis]